MPIEHINKTDTLNEGREKINEAIDGANAADVTSKAADTKATQALANSESTQTQLDTIVIDGDSSVEAAQARVDEKGVSHSTLKARIDDGMNSVNQQLAQTGEDLKERGINILHHGVVGDGVTDDTVALQNIINNSESQVIIVPIPPNYYKITDTIIIRSYRKIIFQGNGHWGVNTLRNIKFSYEGELARDKAMFLISEEEPGIEPNVARSHVRLEGNVLLDGNDKIGWGLYGAYITNESHIGNVTATRCLIEGIEINKAWYSTFGRLVGRSNLGGGVAIGKHFWGGINGCHFNYIRGWGNGQDGTFSESNYTRARGIFLSLGYGNVITTVISERNFGAGLVYEHGRGSSHKILGVYFEGNGRQAREEGLTPYNWGLIVDGKVGGGKGSTIETVYLSSGSGSQQSVWLTGDSP